MLTAIYFALCFSSSNFLVVLFVGLYPCSLDVVIYIVCIRTKNCNKLPDPKYCGFARILVLRLEELPRKNTTPSASLVRNHVMFVFVKGLMRKKEEKSKKKNV